MVRAVDVLAVILRLETNVSSTIHFVLLIIPTEDALVVSRVSLQPTSHNSRTIKTLSYMSTVYHPAPQLLQADHLLLDRFLCTAVNSLLKDGSEYCLLSV